MISRRSPGAGHQHHHDNNAPQRQQRRDPEHRGQATCGGDDRPDYQGDGKRQANTHADDGHGLGALLLAGQVGHQGHNRGGDCAGTLQCAPQDNTPEAVCQCREHAAGGKQQQAADDHRLAAHLVGQPAQGNLQQGLGQAINAQGQADQAGRGIGQVRRVQGQQGQHHEEAQHAKAVEQRQ